MVDAARDIAVVIPNWNGRDLLAPCLESVRQTCAELCAQIIVVDNASADDSVELLRGGYPEVEVLENPRNEGFARACNRGAAASAAPFILMLNTDTVLQPHALARLREVLRTRPRAALVGPQLRYPGGEFQSSYSPFPDLWQEWMIVSGLGRLLHGAHYPSRGPEEALGARPGDWVGGACMLVRREAFDAVGRLDEGYFMYAEEMDLCYRLHQTGWEVWYEPAAIVVHAHGGSSRRIAQESEARHYRSRIRYYRLHHGATAASLVRALIFATTAVKIALHGVLRVASGGRHGRRVVSLRQLRSELRQG